MNKHLSESDLATPKVTTGPIAGSRKIYSVPEAAPDLRVPLRGIIVGESEGAVRFRIGDAWDIDIYKPMILAVEQDNWASLVMN